MSEKLNEKLQVTSLEEIRNRACQVVALPGWEPGETFNVRIRRASLLSLIQQGTIPNQLLPVIHKIIKKDEEKMGSKEGFNPLIDLNPEELTQFIAMLDAVCKAVMVEPKYDDVAEYLTDTQRITIFFYAQGGLNSLETFRRRQESLVTVSSNRKGVRAKAK